MGVSPAGSKLLGVYPNCKTGQVLPVNSQPFPELPSQSSVPDPQLLQAVPEHTWVVGVHDVVTAYWPFALQVSTECPEHRVAPGTQTPVQDPFTHAEATHADSGPH
jgi:hypothetical protein